MRQESDAARFDAALGRAGIPHFRRPADTWSDTPAGRALLLWLRLEEEGFRRDDVLDVLELSNVSSPDPHAPHFRGLARQCGVLRGLEAWDAAVARLAAASSEQEDDEDSRSRFASRMPGGPAAAKRLAERWAALRDSASGWPAGPLTFAGWASEVQRRVERLFAPDDVPAPAAAALRRSRGARGGRRRGLPRSRFRGLPFGPRLAGGRARPPRARRRRHPDRHGSARARFRSRHRDGPGREELSRARAPRSAAVRRRARRTWPRRPAGRSRRARSTGRPKKGCSSPSPRTLRESASC